MDIVADTLKLTISPNIDGNGFGNFFANGAFIMDEHILMAVGANIDVYSNCLACFELNA